MREKAFGKIARHEPGCDRNTRIVVCSQGIGTKTVKKKNQSEATGIKRN